MAKNKIKMTDKEINQEILRKGKGVVADFDESKKYTVRPLKSESKLISMRIPITMLEQLRQVAIQKGNIGYQQVIKTYIFEGLRREIKGEDHEILLEPNTSCATSGSVTTEIYGVSYEEESIGRPYSMEA